MNRRQFFATILCFLISSSLMLSPGWAESEGKTIIDEWSSVTPPSVPKLTQVIVDPATTALLILDIQSGTCNITQRPRCAATVPTIKELLTQARTQGMPVIYSLTSAATPADIVPDIAPLEGEPIVKASVDKFFGTDLDKLLQERGTKKVIIVGSAAHGAVLHTATAAAIRGYQVIVPVDGMSADVAYAEQYTAWHLINSPGTRNKVVLTQLNLLQITGANP